MKKKIAALILAVMLLSSVAIAAAAEGVPTIRVSSAEAKCGEEVSLTVGLENNPGICAYTLNLVYDASRLTLIEITNPEIGNSIYSITGSEVAWVAFDDSRYNGTIFTAKFKVLDNAPTGNAAVTISYSAGDIGNVAEEEVNFSVVAGAVNVVCEHAWNSGEVTTVPGCETPGVKTYTCSKCGGTKTETLAALGHKSDAGTVTKEPTCTEEGVKTYSCIVCGKVLKTENIPALGHTWDTGKVTTEPTCTEKGVKTYTCTVCGETKTEEVPALGHTWDAGKVTTEPTCTEKGEKTYTCTVCGETKTEEIPALEHEWDNGVVTKAATNTSEGEKTYTCKLCGETRIEKIPVVKDDSKPATGDTSAPAVYALLLVFSAGAAVTVTRKLRKTRG